MRRLAVSIGILLGAAIGWAVFTSAPVALAAKNACICSCASDGAIVPPNSVAAASSTVGVFTNLSAGQTSCRADCAQVCGGTAQLASDGRIVSVDCIPGSNDCSTGSVSIYKGVSCVLQTAADQQNWTETSGKKPACVIPVTFENANLECAYYGGIAKGGGGGTIVTGSSIFDVKAGGACGQIASGEDPNSYFKSRSKIGAVGTDYTGLYTFPQWQALMNNEHPNNEINPQDGICYRYGALYGVGAQVGVNADVQANVSVGTSGITGSQSGSGIQVTGIPSNAFVCLKKKTSTCGSVAPPTYLTPTVPARSYSCQKSADVSANGKNPSQVCFPTSGSDGKGNSYADLCVTQPGTVCCQGGTVFSGCLSDADCSADRSKVCQGANPLKLIEGKCVVNTQCDPDAAHNITIPSSFSSTPWLIDNRRCRYASDVEKANPSICTPESILPNAPSRCPNTAQACCRAANPAVTSGCAADLVVLAGASSAFNDFQCVPTTGLPDSQFVTQPDGSRHLVGIEDDYTTTLSSSPENYDRSKGHYCLTGSAPKYQNGQLAGSVSRCSTPGQVCCDPGPLNVADTRKALNSPCGTKQGAVCRRLNDLLPPTDAAAVDRGFASRDAYLVALTQNAGCQVTPFAGGGATGANQECVAGGICCLQSMAAFGASYCADDTACGTGLVCDAVLHICEAKDLRDTQLQSGSCAARARAEIGTKVDEIINANPTVPEEVYACQTVAADATDAKTKCLPAGAGCGDTTQTCCIPGVGQTAASSAKPAAAASAASAPFSIRLSSCIKDGNCSLDDVIYTGAGFANFLIQIAGAIFLAIFVWGGFKYLTAGTSNRAAEAKKMIVQATLAMVLLLGAFTLISFIQSSLIGAASSSSGASSQSNPGQSAACSARSTATQSYACQFLRSSTTADQNKEISDRACVRNLCPGPANYVCCPQ